MCITLLLGALVIAGVVVAAGTLEPELSYASALEPMVFDTLYVAPDCTGLPTPCYTSVQDAVDSADGPADTIRVAQGTYTDVQARGFYTQVVYLTKTVTIRGGFSPDLTTWDPEVYPTVLDAQRQGHVFTIFGSASPVIEGLRITGGDAQAGGGIYGGGILAVGDSGPALTVTLRYNHIIDNYNTVGYGGGGGLAAIFSNILLEGNHIEHNEATGVGGGARFEQSNVDMWGNIVRHNSSDSSGGGLYLAFLTNASMANTVIADNGAGFAGGGIVASGAYVRMSHTTLARNSSGDGSGFCVITGQYGSVVSTVQMTNSIVVSHTVGLTVTAGNDWYSNTLILDSTLWDGSGQLAGGAGDLALTNVYVGDPEFSGDGYHIGPTSYACDRGVNAGVNIDIDGQPRPAGPGYDLGADEYIFRAYLPVIHRGT